MSPASRVQPIKPNGSRLLVITLSNIGDLVMTTPVLEALAQRYPQIPMEVVADPRSASLLSAAPYISRIHERDKRAGWAAQLALLRRLRQVRYSLVVDLRTQLIPWLLRADQRWFKPRQRHAGLHAVDEHMTALTPLALEEVPACRIHIPEAAHRAARTLLEEDYGKAFLVLAPGANWPGKRWPRAAYRALIDRVQAQFNAVVILGAAGDLDGAFDTVGTRLPVRDLSARTDLLTAAAILERARAFVGNDSGLGHIAAAVGAPTLTVFGPGDPPRYAPRGAATAVVLAPDRDLARLEVEPVATRLTALLANHPAQN